MLVLGRRTNESVMIDDDIKIKIVNVDRQNGYVHIGFEAPREKVILREEIWERMNGDMDRIFNGEGSM